MKKFLTLLLAFVMVCSLVACGEQINNHSNNGIQDNQQQESTLPMGDTPTGSQPSGNEDTSDQDMIIEIIDLAERDNIPCDAALQNFYTDAEYEYFYPCIKSELVIVKYSDGSEKTVEEALKIGDITIEDLGRFEISYYKETLDGKEGQWSNKSETFQKAKLNVAEISSVNIKLLTSLDGGPKQKIITDKTLISEMVEYWNNVALRNKVDRPKPGTTLIVVFNSDTTFSINDGYLGYDGNYYEQPSNLEEQFKKYYDLAKEDETIIEF